MQMEKLESRTEKAFQSHIGAIRMQMEKLESRTEKAFQSHIGAIRIESLQTTLKRKLDFNPTLVQLEFLATLNLFSLFEISIPHWCN